MTERMKEPVKDHALRREKRMNYQLESWMLNNSMVRACFFVWLFARINVQMNPALTSLPSHYLLSHQTLPQDRVSSVEPPQNVYEIKVPFITAKMTSSLQSRMSSVGDCVDWLGQRPRLRSEELSKPMEPLLINTVRPLLHQPPPPIPLVAWWSLIVVASSRNDCPRFDSLASDGDLCGTKMLFARRHSEFSGLFHWRSAWKLLSFSQCCWRTVWRMTESCNRIHIVCLEE